MHVQSSVLRADCVDGAIVARPSCLFYNPACALVQCATFDSKSQHVAAGDCSGCIIIWSGLPAAAQRAAAGTAPSEPRTAGMQLFEPPRWHAHAVGALCFSHDGAYLLSGGLEKVLVIWQLETLDKTFLPRLGGPITHVTRSPSDAACYALGQQDNAVRLVSLARMEVCRRCMACGRSPLACRVRKLQQAAACSQGQGIWYCRGRAALCSCTTWRAIGTWSGCRSSSAMLCHPQSCQVRFALCDGTLVML